MTPITYRIPITTYVINEEQALENDVLQILEGIRKHLYLVANIAYQHYYQLLDKNDPIQKSLYTDYNLFQEADKAAWEKLNNAKLDYVHSSSAQKRVNAKEVMGRLPAEIKEIRNKAKRRIYDFVKEDSFIVALADKFKSIIPPEVIHYSLAKVIQELYTDYPYIHDDKIRQPLRVYSNNFPICFGWGEELKESFKWLDEKKSGKRSVQFYLFRWLNNDAYGFRCRIGKGLPDLAELLTKIGKGEISYPNIGDSTIQYTGKKKWVLQFTYKPDPVVSIFEEKKTLAMGVDLGYKVPISWAIADENNITGEIGEVDEIREKRRELLSLYRKKIAAIRYTRHGKGRSRKTAILRACNYQERSFFRNLNAEWAHKLLDIAVEHQVAMIKIEDLDFEEAKKQNKIKARNINLQLTQRGIKKVYPSPPDNLLTIFRNWSYSDLLNRIEKEAEQRGVMVARINPSFTSRCCWKCGVKGVRKKQAHLCFTQKQAGKCPFKISEECVLLRYEKKENNRKKGSSGKAKNGNTKTNQASFSHYLMADQNAALRIARAEQYDLKKSKL